MIKEYILLTLLLVSFNLNAKEQVAQDSMKQEKVKLDGVATVVGKNIVLDSEIAAYKLDLERQSEGKVDISDCDMLEQIMNRKLLAHHAVVDSLVVTDPEINSRVERNIAYFLRQLGSEEKLVNFYGFDNIGDLRKEFIEIEREALLIQKMQEKLTSEVD
ncbi:MAG: peptidylprolyl isomerase, partial [Aureibaculum sp.]